MIFVFLAAVIFGFVHPGSKLLLGSGIDLLTFCLLYVGIRLLAQIPFVVASGAFRIATKKQWLILGSIGIVGAALQMTEFMGIADGLPVPIVTFLVYTHPIWTILLGRILNSEKITTLSIAKLSLGISGSAFIFLTQVQSVSGNLRLMVAPIIAGLMIALWITLSRKAKSEKIGTSTISFYYDLFAFLALLGLHSANVTKTLPLQDVWGTLAEPKFLFAMIAYSIFVGLLPNLLFYRGSQSVTALTAGLILLLEPVVATLSSSLLWHTSLPALFTLGAGFVLLSGAPLEDIPLARLKAVVRGVQFKAAAVRSLFLLLALVSIPSEAGAIPKNVLHVLEVVPSDEGDYTNSKEVKSIEVASEFAISDFKKINPKCSFTVDKSLSRGSEEELFKKVSTIAKAATSSEIIVGMTRSSFARVAANAAKGSSLKAISIGAATANLAEINKDFVSVAAPWMNQWEAIEGELLKSQCTPETTLGFFDPNDYLSRQFRESFETKFGKKQSFSFSDFGLESKNLGLKKSCLFVAVNFSKAQAPLAKLAGEKLKLTVLGIGDWNYYAPELRTLLTNTKPSWNVSVPTGWVKDVSQNSEAFSRRFETAMKEEASPVAAYTYDAVMMALYSLCEKIGPNTFSQADLKKMTFLLRNYQGLADSNNFKSQMQLVKFTEAK